MSVVVYRLVDVPLIGLHGRRLKMESQQEWAAHLCRPPIDGNHHGLFGLMLLVYHDIWINASSASIVLAIT